MNASPEQIRKAYARYGIGLDRSDARGECRLRCPFHDDRNPSFSINAQTGLWRMGRRSQVVFDSGQRDCEDGIVFGVGPEQLPVRERDLGVSEKIRFEWDWRGPIRPTEATVKLLRSGWGSIVGLTELEERRPRHPNFDVFCLPERCVFTVPRSAAAMFRAFLETTLSCPEAWLDDMKSDGSAWIVKLRASAAVNMVPAAHTVNVGVLIQVLREMHQTWWRQDVRKGGKALAMRRRIEERKLVWREFRRPYRTEAQTWIEVDEILPAREDPNAEQSGTKYGSRGVVGDSV